MSSVSLSPVYHHTTEPPLSFAALCQLVSPKQTFMPFDEKHHQKPLDADHEEQSAYAHTLDESSVRVETSIEQMKTVSADPSSHIEAQRLIGGVTASQMRTIDPHFVNPLSPSGIMWDQTTRQYMRADDYQTPPAESNVSLLTRLMSRPTGVQMTKPAEGPLLPDELNPFKYFEMDMTSKLSVMARPQFIRPRDFFRWVKLPKAFPIWVNFENFGSALALRHLAWSADGAHMQHRFAVKKLIPLGYVEGAPFNGGVWSVPVQWCVRLPLAVMDLLPASDYVTLVDDRGERWSESFVEFSNNTDWRFEMARNALVMDQPNLLADLFATRLLTEPPNRYKRSTFSLPPNLDTPAVVNLRDASFDRQAPSEENEAAPETAAT